MKKLNLSSAAITVLFLLALATGYGQSLDPIYVNVPFEFTAGITKMPAGEYTVTELRGSAPLLLIRSKDCRITAVVLAQSAYARKIPETAQLVFNRYGRQNFLHKVWTAGSDVGREIPKSPAERELAGGLKSNREMVVLTGHRAR